MKKLLAKNEATQKETHIHSTADGLYVETRQKVDGVMDYAKRQANEWRPGSLIGNTQKHQQSFAEFPPVIYYDLLAKFGQPRDNPKDWMRWLEENPAFKTTGGRLI
jgi:hypothetical protein